ncbi:Esterase PHB depolymerase [Modicisalibacter ilicicola DSM 19980]|uniref:Esterase PHB depolymerase n=1 Tax=Modicisalibacter ilicicola DSM 19980 TaxID=1121942 RepID=A0A1M5AGG4_9GAMM|nr:PHB depolymerase family esterase [Halomonas ilicicola]SHF28982.1 Esterase PHB depolymerase [Halomonas ilicicola DSM 19980]
MTFPIALLLVWLTLPASAVAAEDAKASPLAVLDIEPEAISVMGVSSGGYMATQLAVAWPERFSGLAVFAAGPWGCAQGTLALALTQCMNTRLGLPDLATLENRHAAYLEKNQVGSPGALARQRVYLWHGQHDEVVDPRLTELLAEQYREWLETPESQLEVVYSEVAAHGWPVAANASEGADLAPCTQGGSPYLLRCNFDGAGQALEWLYPERLEAPRGDGRGMLMRFDQTAFHEGGLAEEGYVYIPKTCEEGAPCALTVALHGCSMGSAQIGETFVRHSGLNAWAAENQLVVLYPQARPSLPNPKGCWDWWGYDESSWQRDPGYDSRQGQQIQALKAMVDHIAGKPQ